MWARKGGGVCSEKTDWGRASSVKGGLLGELKLSIFGLGSFPPPSLLVLDCSSLAGFPQEKQLFLCQNAK